MLLPVCLVRDVELKRVNNLARRRWPTYRARTDRAELPTCCSLEIFIDRLIHRRVMKNLLSLQRRALSGDVMKSVPTRQVGEPSSQHEVPLEVLEWSGQMHTLLL